MKFGQDHFHPLNDESVLDLLLRHNQKISFSCKSGHCQSCLLKLLAGELDNDATKGLKLSTVEQGYFLACQQKAATVTAVCRMNYQELFSQARLIDKHMYSPDLCRLILQPTRPLLYHAGQFINLKNANNTIRSYSLASLPAMTSHLELHIKRKPNGVMSQWLIDTFSVGQYIDFQGPIGDCFYTESGVDSSLILIGTGTGAAPLLGITQDAIYSQHKGPIHFYHGVTQFDELYLDPLLKKMQKTTDNFHYHPCVGSEKNTPASHAYKIGRCNEIAMTELKVSKDTTLFICGNPEMVRTTQKQAFLAGISASNIHTDAFEYRDLRTASR